MEMITYTLISSITTKFSYVFLRPKLWSIFNLRPEQYSGEMDLVNLTKTQQEHSVYNLIRVNSWIGKKKKKKKFIDNIHKARL